MYKITMLILILSTSLMARERVSGRSPAIIAPASQIFDDLRVSGKREAEVVIKEQLELAKKDSAARNKLLWYRDSILVKNSGIKKVTSYHPDTWAKKWHRFQNRIQKSLNLGTVFELLGLILLITIFMKDKDSKKRISSKKLRRQVEIRDQLFSSANIKSLKANFDRFGYFQFKNKVQLLLAEIQFQLDTKEPVVLDLVFNSERIFLNFLFPVQLSDDKKRMITNICQQILKSEHTRFVYTEVKAGESSQLSISFAIRTPLTANL